jgi:SOS response regulatory protein OraA/RecX
MRNLPQRSGRTTNARRQAGSDESPAKRNVDLRRRIRLSSLSDAVRFLARSDRSAGQVQRHLTRRGYAPGEIRTTLGRLHRLGYLDDDKVALRLAESQLLRRPVGGQGLQELLRRRGFRADTIDRAMRKLYDDTTEHTVATRFLMTLPVKLKDTMREAERRARLLRARCFSEEVIESVLSSAGALEKP